MVKNKGKKNYDNKAVATQSPLSYTSYDALWGQRYEEQFHHNNKKWLLEIT